MSRLRPARPEELSSLTELCLRSKAYWGYDQAFMAACVPELTLTKADLATRLVVLDEKGATLGLAQVWPADDDADLLKLFVDPACIGQGHGRTLMSWALDTAPASRAVRLLIEADPGAVPFYAKFGSRQIGTVPSDSIAGRVLPHLAIDLQTCPVKG